MDDLQQCDASDSDSDSDYMEGVEGSQSDSDSGDVYVPDFIQSQPIGLPTKDASLLLPVSINPVGLPEFWCQRMHVFFYPTVRPDQETGLLNLMHKIKLPLPQLEAELFFTDLPVDESDNYRGGTQIAGPKPDQNYKFTGEDALELFVFISRNHLMHPWVFDPISVFFLLSRDSFVYNSELWLAPALRTLDYLVWRPNFPGTVGSTQPPVDQRPSTKGQKRNTSKRNKKENARKEPNIEEGR
ncbi:hypothetical protein B0H17DRAFT_1135874 [Mycena rosella]|uniref:Uncharacterized protein n=1 Tax=Mycena rosella TaxID=1033263 RepID=A0AAD7GCF7_MYCRO|nr:hypothetical protein B0H17DRAFT_1135874 [Mycena rosella]